MREPVSTLGDLSPLARLAAGLGVVGFLICLAGGAVDLPQLYRSYLVAWLFWLSVTLGCWAWMLIYNLTGGGWGRATHAIMRAAAAPLPLLALLFLPLVTNLEVLYPWARPGEVASDPLLQHKQPYLNVPFFLGRTAGYFLVWLVMAWLVRLCEGQFLLQGGEDRARRLRRTSAIGLLLYATTITFASIDWCMSLEPHWYSAIYGILFMIGQGLTGLAFMVSIATCLPQRTTEPQVAAHRIDLGKLLLAFTMLWAYVSFSQYLIIWYGNIPEEVVWYERRLEHGWQWFALSLVVLQFALPFFLLLSRDAKEQRQKLAKVALLLLAMRWVELVWLIEPAFERSGMYVPWLDLAAAAALGGLWLALFAWRLRYVGVPAEAPLEITG